MKRISLTQSKFALVDDADYKYLSRYKWYPVRMRNTLYALRNIRGGKRGATESMHRRLLKLKKGDRKIADHIDQNGLNNQRDNLRVATVSQSNRNQEKQCNNTSGFKGVCWHKGAEKWMAQIRVNSQQIYLGCFDSKISAAVAYNEAAIRYFGKFAKLNRISRYLQRNRGQEELAL